MVTSNFFAPKPINKVLANFLQTLQMKQVLKEELTIISMR